MVLTDDNFATIVDCRRGGPSGLRQRPQVHPLHLRPRRPRGHAVPRVRAGRRGRSRCRSRCMQILAIDLGTDTLPALALSREPAEPGLMDRPPRPRTQGRRSAAPMLARAWGLPRPHLRCPGDGRVLRHRCSAAGWHPGYSDRPGYRAQPRLPAGDHHHLAGHRRLPDRHRVRRPHGPGLAAVGGRLHQPVPARRHRASASLSPRCSSTCRRSKPSSAPQSLTHRSAAHRRPVPVHRLGR